MLFTQASINIHLKKFHSSVGMTFKHYSETYLSHDPLASKTDDIQQGPSLTKCPHCSIFGTKEQITSHTLLQHTDKPAFDQNSIDDNDNDDFNGSGDEDNDDNEEDEEDEDENSIEMVSKNKEQLQQKIAVNRISAKQENLILVTSIKDRCTSRCIICGLEGNSDSIFTHVHHTHKDKVIKNN